MEKLNREPEDGGALAGIRVLDLSRLLPGALASMLLGDFGADVVKVEDLGQGDYARWMGPGYPTGDSSTRSAFFLALNRNKRSIRLDLKKPGGREAFLLLAERADVVLESYRPGVMERLGIGADALLEANPRLVVCQISGYGQSGPGSQRAGHDLNYLAAIGILDLCREPGQPPAVPGVQLADVGGGSLMATLGILLALRRRETTGQGQAIDVSMAHASLPWAVLAAAQSLTTGSPVGPAASPLTGAVACYGVYPCADGYVTLAALEPKFWRALCEGLERPHLLGEAFAPRDSAVGRELETAFSASSRAELSHFARRWDCCLEPVRSLDEALSSELLSSRGSVVSIERGGGESARVLGSPLRMSATEPVHDRLPPPPLGAHTEEVLVEAGYGPAEIASLRREGAVGTAEDRDVGKNPIDR